MAKGSSSTIWSKRGMIVWSGTGAGACFGKRPSRVFTGVHAGDLPAELRQSIQVFMLLDVIEHMPEPVSFFSGMRRFSFCNPRHCDRSGAPGIVVQLRRFLWAFSALRSVVAARPLRLPAVLSLAWVISSISYTGRRASRWGSTETPNSTDGASGVENGDARFDFQSLRCRLSRASKKILGNLAAFSSAGSGYLNNPS